MTCLILEDILKKSNSENPILTPLSSTDSTIFILSKEKGRILRVIDKKDFAKHIIPKCKNNLRGIKEKDTLTASRTAGRIWPGISPLEIRYPNIILTEEYP